MFKKGLGTHRLFGSSSVLGRSNAIEAYQSTAVSSPLLNGLDAYWKLDEVSGIRADSVGASNLTDNNTVGQAAGVSAGTGNSASFVKVNSEYLNCASNAALQIGSGSFTIAGWLYFVNNNSTYCIAKSNEYLLDIYPWRFIVYGLTGGTLSLTGVNPLKNTWYFVRCWYDKTNAQVGMQINDTAPVTQAVTGGAVVNGAGAFCISLSDRFINGQADEWAKWSRVLTAAEHTELYNGGLGRTYPFDGSASTELALYSPVQYQTFQRSSSAAGSITITGIVKHVAADVEARFNGGAWQAIASAVKGVFTATLTGQTPGQGLLEVRAGGSTVTVANVGLGDIFVIAGQSNPSARGINNQTYSHATLKATMFGNDYNWKELSDPTDSATGQIDAVSNDGVLAAGSMWPPMVTALMASQGVPVAIVPCAKGNTSITDWQPGANHQNRATLYGSMTYRALQTGAKYVLWHQGEGDTESMTQAQYNAYLDTLANSIAADFGGVLIPCLLQDLSHYTPPIDNSVVNAAIIEAQGDNPNVLVGPDFSDIDPSIDHLHFKTDTELQTVGQRWAAAIIALL